MLKKDFELNNFDEVFHPQTGQKIGIISKSRYTINGNEYRVRGYDTILNNMPNSSWWFEP